MKVKIKPSLLLLVSNAMTFLRPLVQAAVTRNSFIQSAQPLACIHHTFHQSSGSSNQSTEIRRKINTAFCHGNHSMQCLEKKQKHSWKPSYSTISHDHILQSRIAKFQHKHSSYFCNTQSQLYASKEEEIEPTWTYEPYKPPPKKIQKVQKILSTNKTLLFFFLLRQLDSPQNSINPTRPTRILLCTLLRRRWTKRQQTFHQSRTSLPRIISQLDTIRSTTTSLFSKCQSNE